MTPRTGSSLRAAVVLVAVILAGCNPGSPAAPPAGTEPVTPATSAAPGQATPGSAAGDLVVTAITYSEEASSSLFAVAELGPNDEGITRLDFYRGAEGRLSTVVVHGADGLPAFITFDSSGRPLRLEAGGYAADLSYPSPDVEVVVTAPDGSVVRERGPVDLGALVPAPAAPNARLVSFLQEPPAPGMVQWPLRMYSYGTIEIKVVHTGTNAGTLADHVGFGGLRCAPDAGIECAAEILASRTSARLDVASFVRTGEESDPTKWIWRTRDDCDRFTPLAATLVSGAGWGALAIGGIYQVVSVAGAGYPPLGAAIFALGAVIKIWGPGAVGMPACGSVPNLEKLQDSILDALAGSQVTLSVTASGDCDRWPETGWRIKESTQTFAFPPFRPDNRSSFGAAPASAPEVGTITFEAADCAVAMGGTFDLEASGATAGIPKASVSAWASGFTENVIQLELKKTDPEPASPIAVTGTFTLTREDAVCCGTSAPGCTSKETMVGALEGTIAQADGYLANGTATISTTRSTYSCAEPVADRTVPWSAVGDATTLHGAIELSGASGSPGMDFLFTVKEW